MSKRGVWVPAWIMVVGWAGLVAAPVSQAASWLAGLSMRQEMALFWVFWLAFIVGWWLRERLLRRDRA